MNAGRRAGLPKRGDVVMDLLVLLCHKRRCWAKVTGRKQHGHRGSRLASATAISRRIVDIELGV
jgi:hypothetical protein